MNLHGNSLTGTLPAWLGTAPDLQYIDLANNGFTGSVPPFLSSVPQVSAVLIKVKLTYYAAGNMCADL